MGESTLESSGVGQGKLQGPGVVHQNQHLTHELDIKKMISFRNTFTCSYSPQSPNGRTASLTATCPITRIEHVCRLDLRNSTPITLYYI